MIRYKTNAHSLVVVNIQSDSVSPALCTFVPQFLMTTGSYASMTSLHSAQACVRFDFVLPRGRITDHSNTSQISSSRAIVICPIFKH